MKIKIFSCYHFFPEQPYCDKIFQSIVSNIPSKNGVISDLDGYNISAEKDFSELRHQFYVWKNLSHLYDYVGFEHYRRALFIDPFPLERLLRQFDEIFALRQNLLSNNRLPSWDCYQTFQAYLRLRSAFTEEDHSRIEHWLGGFDFVVPRPYDQNIHAQWKIELPSELWEKIVGATIASPYFSTKKCLINFEMENIYFKNIYIMKKDLFIEYMEFCFNILFDLFDQEAFRKPRLIGMVSERLFSFYFNQKRMENPLLRVCTLPLVSAI